MSALLGQTRRFGLNVPVVRWGGLDIGRFNRSGLRGEYGNVSYLGRYINENVEAPTSRYDTSHQTPAPGHVSRAHNQPRRTHQRMVYDRRPHQGRLSTSQQPLLISPLKNPRHQSTEPLLLRMRWPPAVRNLSPAHQLDVKVQSVVAG